MPLPTFINIMVVDDEPEIPRGIELSLDSPKYRIVGFVNPRDAIAAASHQPFAVAIVDLNIGGLSGVEVMKELRCIRPEIQIIVLTGYPSVDSAIEAVNQRAFRYIRKPFGIRDLREAVEGALAAADRDRSDGYKELENYLGNLKLSKREAEVVRELFKGKDALEICHDLSIARRTVYIHIRNAYAKLGVSSRHELLVKIRAGLRAGGATNRLLI